jgi:hypothetical protein
MEIQMLHPDKPDRDLIVYERRLIRALAIPARLLVPTGRTRNQEFGKRMYKQFYGKEETADE